jgi:hypothetical protein
MDIINRPESELYVVEEDMQSPVSVAHLYEVAQKGAEMV